VDFSSSGDAKNELTLEWTPLALARP